MKLIKKYFPILYVTVLFFGILYVNKVLNEESISVEKTEEIDKNVEEVKPITVRLIVNYVAGYDEHLVEMQNVNTFDDLLEKLRDYKEFYFEKTEYTYGTSYDPINQINSPDGYTWKLYVVENYPTNNSAVGFMFDFIHNKNLVYKEITFNTSGRKLIDGALYYITLEKSD